MWPISAHIHCELFNVVLFDDLSIIRFDGDLADDDDDEGGGGGARSLALSLSSQCRPCGHLQTIPNKPQYPIHCEAASMVLADDVVGVVVAVVVVAIDAINKELDVGADRVGDH